VLNNRAMRRLGISVGIAAALMIGLAACSKSTVTSWAVPDSYNASSGGRVLVLNVYGGDCDLPLSAQVLGQDDQKVTVGVLRRVPNGPCNAMAVMHHVSVTLAAPLADRAVHDRSGAVIPANPSSGGTPTATP